MAFTISRLSLVRETTVEYDFDQPSPQQYYKLLEAAFKLSDSPQERLVAAFLDTRLQPIGLAEISRGGLNSSMVPIPEVLKCALLHNARGIVIAHNHPSGNPDPSKEDITITKRLAKAAETIGLKLYDHIVVGWADSLGFISLNRLGYVKA